MIVIWVSSSDLFSFIQLFIQQTDDRLLWARTECEITHSSPTLYGPEENRDKSTGNLKTVGHVGIQKGLLERVPPN